MMNPPFVKASVSDCSMPDKRSTTPSPPMRPSSIAATSWSAPSRRTARPSHWRASYIRAASPTPPCLPAPGASRRTVNGPRSESPAIPNSLDPYLNIPIGYHIYPIRTDNLGSRWQAGLNWG